MKLFSLCGLIVGFCIKLQFVAGKGSNYLITLQNEKVMTACEQHKDNFITNFFDLSGLTFQYLDDDKLLVKGPLKFIATIPKDAVLEIDFQVFKKQRGQWASTVYNLRRPNLCEALFSPTEMWFHYTDRVKKDQRTCPPNKDDIIDVDSIADFVLKDHPDRNFDGDYKVQGKITHVAKPDEFVCFNILFNSQKI